MSDLDVVRSGLASSFISARSRLHELVEPLRDEELWIKPYAYGNSVGNLILHLTGNLNYYIGAQIAQTGYIRHRDEEFTNAGVAKQELTRQFDSAIEMVLVTIARQSDRDWSAGYSATGAQAKDRFTMLLVCATHAHHHLGQIIYLQRELLGRRDR